MKNTKITKSEKIKWIQLEKENWLKKMYYHLDKRRFKNNLEHRDFIINEFLEVDKCCLINDYYVNTHIPKFYKGNKSKKELEIDRKQYIKDSFTLYSLNGFGINHYRINQWYKECKNDLLKRI